ncbi:prolipoprotein diacylglyceryl transferase [mine drainage metagenome]|uniref:Prolipoprotein diacylglyceryl transferase n=1 Tax=mine drainage metagenome TaxID=410659 RepID=A0A1J5RXP3_9ZZZZ
MLLKLKISDMYPNLYYAFKDIFHVDWSFLRLINSFGFFVAISFILAAWVLTLELRRKQSLGLLVFTEQTIIVGGTASITDLIINFALGFVMGFKIIGAFITPNALNDPQSYILSMQGSIPFGLLLGLAFAGLKWWEKYKQKLDKPESRTIRIWPQDRVGDMVIFAALFGFAGAKFFNNLENWDEFVKHPLEGLASFSGLTFYGGLICATIALYFYAKKYQIPFIHLCDAAAPGLMLAYAIGRIGCQVAGDGDWGILNSAFISDTQGKLITATPEQYNAVLQSNHHFYAEQFATSSVHALHVQPFWGLPNWLFGYNYPHNVISEGINFAGCQGNYCSYLPISVFPTPFYETVMCLIIFAAIWFFRKKFKVSGRLFAVYLIANGIERFFIEKIRVNLKYNGLPFHPTQAELISLGLFLAGIILYWLAPQIKLSKAKAI